MEGEVLEFFKGSKLLLLVTQEPMKVLNIAFLLVAYSGEYVKFTPKHTIVGDEGGY